MRTIIDIPTEILSALDSLKKQRGGSRADLIRRALESFILPYATEDQAMSTHKAIGLWTDEQDAVEFQRKLRAEWD